MMEKEHIGIMKKAFSIANLSDLMMREIKFVGKNVNIKVGDKVVKTREILNAHGIIYYPLTMSYPEMGRWKNEAALKVYFDEVMTDKIPGGFTYTYGFLMRHPVNQVDLVIEKLKEDRNSRQATIMLGDGNCLKEESPACCRIVDFKIREDYLNMFLLFRSHDITAYYPNLRAFAKLQEYIANEVGAKIGVLGCTSESLHLYEGDCDLIGWKSFDEVL